MVDKAEGAFWTIGELSEDLNVPQHVLRYWETRFKRLRPVTRAGNRRYYRPEDVALVRTIHQKLNEEGYTIKGVQMLLDQNRAGLPTEASSVSTASPSRDHLIIIRNALVAALAG